MAYAKICSFKKINSKTFLINILLFIFGCLITKLFQSLTFLKMAIKEEQGFWWLMVFSSCGHLSESNLKAYL